MFDIELMWRYYMEVDNEYIYVDLLDIVGEVCFKVYMEIILR